MSPPGMSLSAGCWKGDAAVQARPTGRVGRPLWGRKAGIVCKRSSERAQHGGPNAAPKPIRRLRRHDDLGMGTPFR